MKTILLIFSSLVAGFLGGLIALRLANVRDQHRADLIQARRFELLDGTGQAIAYWGMSPTNQPVLAFVSGGKADRMRASFGMQTDNGPFLRLQSSDSRLGILMNTDYFGRPAIAMKDDGPMGIFLGVEQSDTPELKDKAERWVLTFLPDDRARIGAYTEDKSGNSYIHGVLAVHPEALKSPGSR